ncbi:hypothetical protein VTN31DRAFT_4833 [Thermomyces dupontii]|uniref:uncharacterized protein n=1 Tax=Talaromyces thermophilus TaxID=28565 RepID=UPI0037421E0B
MHTNAAHEPPPRRHKKKKKHPALNPTAHGKRIQVTDDDGWTHVINSGSLAMKRPAAAVAKNHNHHEPQAAPPNNETSPPSHTEPTTTPIIQPAEAPRRLTLTLLKRQFADHSATWSRSATCETLTATVRSSLAAHAVDKIVCIGLGSPSGFVGGGWVDRRSVALYQLAALRSIMDCPALHQPSSSHRRVPVYAQDPVFNALDVQLLASLGITVVSHPAGFEMVDGRTFLYAPGAERKHLEVLLEAGDPPLVFGGPLEDFPSEPLSAFLARRNAVRVPEFDANGHAFWKMSLYYPKP